MIAARANVSAGFLADMLAGLTARPKALAPKWFYDARGSELFEAITRLPEYYPTRVETALLREKASEMAAGIEAGVAVVEWGSGSSAKTPLLLAALDRPSIYAPVDVSANALLPAAARIRAAFPGLNVRPVEADFTQPFALPREVAAAPARLGFFPGSTIGNFTPGEAVPLLAAARRTLGGGAHFLLGVDTPKEEALLRAAYDDAEGVTAAFNLNLLVRANRELGADFNVSAFAHEARWNAGQSRVEMHLVSLRPQRVHLAGQAFDFIEGETIHTENSYKHAPGAVARLVAEAGWRLEAQWLAPQDAFALYRLAAA